MSEIVRILIIDDSEDDRLLYRRTLQKQSDLRYSVTEVDDGEKGLSHIAKDFPDCVLLDYSLPGYDGIEIIKRIRAEYSFLPVIMLTGQGNENVAVAAMREGAQDYIAKSAITPETLRRVIDSSIQQCVLHQRIHEQRVSLEIFTRALAHDLKEPVRTIRSFLDLMALHEKFSDKGKEFLDYIQKAAIRMDSLIDTVFFYTQLDDPERQISKEICEVGKAFEDAKENLRELIRERKAVITCDFLPKLHVNPPQLIQVLQNLLCNAIRHCEDMPVIHFGVEEGAKHWLFRMQDSGPGIDKGAESKIFEPFKRMSRHKERGLGLGLSICKKIVESHGGKIWYESRAKVGATFIFTLPKALVGVEVAEASEAASSASGFAADEEIGTILLVEDNDADIELTRILLLRDAKLRCNLLVAHDAFEALTMMRAEVGKTGAVDLMLLDINMPGMSGLELLDQMQEDPKLSKVPVVMCTTSNYGKDRETAKLLGAVGYMTKPAELRKLKAIIDETDGIRLCREGSGYALLRAA